MNLITWRHPRVAHLDGDFCKVGTRDAAETLQGKVVCCPLGRSQGPKRQVRVPVSKMTPNIPELLVGGGGSEGVQQTFSPTLLLS